MTRIFLPRSTLGQLLAIIVAVLVISWGSCFGLLWLLSPLLPLHPIGPGEQVMAISSTMKALVATPAEHRAEMAKAISSPRFGIRVGAVPSACLGRGGAVEFIARQLRLLMPEPEAQFSVGACESTSEIQVVIALGDEVAEFRMADDARLPLFMLGLPAALAGGVFLLVITLALSVWGAWRVTRPLHRLAYTADAFGRSIVAEPIEEQGPREIQQVARAFNRMQNHIESFVNDRARMLAAISHDLRTPLTRMKLRVELEVRGEAQVKILRDIALLQKLIDASLTFLRDEISNEAWDRIDMSALVSTICDEFAEVGVAITCEAPDVFPCRCQPLAIRRAISNLIDNARRYGSLVCVSVRREGDEAVIEVADNGPGIADADKAKALQPFTRLLVARPVADGHAGLGLAIANTVARSHGGRLDLRDNQPKGLIVHLCLAMTGS